MSLVTISAGDIDEYRGTGTPAFARLYANRQFTDTSQVVVAQGSKRKPTFYQQFTCSLVGTKIRVASGDAYSTTDSSVPTADYTLVIYDADGRELYTPFTRLRIPPTPNPTTWDMLRIFSTSVPLRYVPGFLTDNAIYALLANIGSAVLNASDVIYGKAKLSFAALNLSEPIAVGDNDPIIRGIRRTYYLERWGFDRAAIAAAIAAINGAEADLKITAATNVTVSDISIPPNVRLVFEANGSLTCSSPRTITIGKMKDAGDRQIFFGTGNVVLAAGASNGNIRLEWWAQPGTGVNLSDEITEITLSMANGNNVIAGAGTWMFNGWTVPSLSRIQGVGMWDGSGGKKGTIFEPYDPLGLIPNGSFLIKYAEAFRGGEISNLTLNLGTSTGVHALVLEGTYPNSALAAFRAVRVAILGTVNAFDQVVVRTLDPSQWECTSIKFEDGLSVTGTNTTFFTINTVNSGPVFKGWEFLCAAGSTILHLETTGYTRIVDCQFRGVSGSSFPDLTPAAPRVVANTVITNNAGGNNYLDIVGGGQWLEGDIGQKVIRNGATLYITGLEWVSGLVNRAHLTTDPATDATQRPSDVYRFVPNTGLAYAAIHIDGSHATINIENCVDEGFQYFIVHEGLQLEFPLNLRGNKPQGAIRINNSCNINSDGNDYLSQCFLDGNLSQLTRIVSKGDTISPTSRHLFNGLPQIVLDEAQLFSGDRGEGMFIQSGDAFYTGLLKSLKELPLQILDRTTAGTASLPLLSLATARIIGGGLISNIQPMLQFGRLHPSSKKVDYWYQVGYQYFTGILQFWSNVHGAYKGYRFDAKVIAPVFQTDVVTPGSISGDTHNMAIGTTGGIVRLDCTSGWRDITGFALPTDPAVTGFDPIALASYEGCKIEFVYVGTLGTTGVVLKHNNVGSTAANRLYCDWGADIALGTDDRAIGVYRNGKWNISLLSRPEQLYLLAGQQNLTQNSTTLQDTQLFGYVKPGYYEIEATIHSTSASVGAKLTLDGGTFSSSSFRGEWFGATDTDAIGETVTSPATAYSKSAYDGKPVTFKFKGAMVIPNSGAGTIRIRAAQSAAHASTTSILSSSTLKLTPMQFR